jgi:acyl-CoA reductase-like NAD-dependent aldehyde dehydrogenase
VNDFAMTIDGRRVRAADTFEVINPATGKALARAPECSRAQLDEANNNRPQYERVCELVGDALSNGARAAAGGRPMDGDGYFFEPTILADVSDGIRIVDEEQFGPALPVIPYRDPEDALRRANATHFGLSGSVWSSDPDRAGRLARRLECGTAWVNSHVATSPHQPLGGLKWSGVGVENGPWGLAGFTEIQVLYRAK